MAVTSGHGNGLWTRDETILALDLYLAAGKALDKKDPLVQNLSAFLRSLPIHPAGKRNASFRNADGVAFKIKNLRAVQTGAGFKNVSEIDKAVWSELGHQPKVVRELASQIRKACEQLAQISTTAPQAEADAEQEYFSEGGATAVLHWKRERSAGLRGKFIKVREKKGPLVCDACERSAFIPDEGLRPAAFEAHHIRPLAKTGKTESSIADLALLCATCHRLIHRAMIVQKRWVSLPDFKSLMRK